MNSHLFVTAVNNLIFPIIKLFDSSYKNDDIVKIVQSFYNVLNIFIYNYLESWIINFKNV